MPRLLWMDRLRGVAILAVVLLHAELQARGSTGGSLPLVHEVNHLLTPVRMPVLVTLSGILLTPALAKPRAVYVRGKLASLLWPYLVWSVIDVTHLQLRLISRGDGLSPWWVLRILYEPETYLWFLGYVFVYYVVALLVPLALRTAGGPLLLVLAVAVGDDVPADLHKLVWLFGFFLLGDTLGRVGRRWLVPSVATRADPLGYVGRHSLVFYVSHLTVAIFVTDRLVELGVRDVLVVFLACLVVPLAVAALLVESRRTRLGDALFEWPFGSTGRAPLRSSGAHDRTAHDRSLRPAG